MLSTKRLRGAWRAIMPHVAPNVMRTRGYPAGEPEPVEGWGIDAPVWNARAQMASDLLRCVSAPEALREQQAQFGPFNSGRSALEHVRAGLWWHAMRFSMVAELTAGHMAWLAARGATGLSTLEVGCNVGLMSMAIKQRLPHVDVVGVDLQERAIGVAKWSEALLGKGGVRWVLGDGTTLEQQFAPQKFDVVYLCEILEHYDDVTVQHSLLAQACAVCKPGGWVFVSVPFEGRIPIPSHLTVFDQHNLAALIEPFARRVVWFSEERLRYNVDNHFFLAFQPRE